MYQFIALIIITWYDGKFNGKNIVHLIYQDTDGQIYVFFMSRNCFYVLDGKYNISAKTLMDFIRCISIMYQSIKQFKELLFTYPF